MKSNQPENLLKNSIIAAVIGFISWLFLFILFDPLAGLYKIGKFDLDLTLLTNISLYTNINGSWAKNYPTKKSMPSWMQSPRRNWAMF